MGKVLYVRGFDDELHDKLSDQAKKEGVSPASILEHAYDDWLKKREGVQSIHYLLLYSDGKTLENFLKKADGMLDENCVKLCAGTHSHSAMKYLKKHGWIDGSDSSYDEAIKKKPDQVTSKVFDRLAEISSGRYSCYMGFMTEDVALQHSLKKANEIERIYNSKRIPGSTICDNPPFTLDFSSYTPVLNFSPVSMSTNQPSNTIPSDGPFSSETKMVEYPSLT